MIALHLDRNVAFVSRGGYVRRPDYLLDLQQNGGSVRGRYAGERVQGEVGVEFYADARSGGAAALQIDSASFDESHWGGDPSILEAAQQSGVPVPFGFATGYTLLLLRGRGALDSRANGTAPVAGARIAADGDYAYALGGIEGNHWFRIGGQAIAATDALGFSRVVSLALDVSAMFPVGGSQVPFDQTIDVGGLGPMPGFLPGSLRGLSAAALTLAYDWPVWVFLNGRIFLAAGNAFDLHFAGFDLERLRLSFGAIVQPPDVIVHPFELGLGFGTEPFYAGTAISSFRLWAGVRRDL